MDNAPLLPYVSQKKRNSLIRLPFPPFALITVGLPFGAFLFCVYWSTVYNFRESTATHCQVDNYLPSVSAAIGSFSPQKYVWMMCILLHFLPRLSIARQYFTYLKAVLHPASLKIAWVTWLMNVVEVICLLGLTMISSTNIYLAHATFFMMFIVSSIVYMLLSCYLLKLRRLMPTNRAEARSLRLKLLLTSVNLIFFFLAGYCFVRHNSYCEDGVYSWFALCEYVVVLSNMGFHLTAYLDFNDRVVFINTSGITFS